MAPNWKHSHKHTRKRNNSFALHQSMTPICWLLSLPQATGICSLALVNQRQQAGLVQSTSCLWYIIEWERGIVFVAGWLPIGMMMIIKLVSCEDHPALPPPTPLLRANPFACTHTANTIVKILHTLIAHCGAKAKRAMQPKVHWFASTFSACISFSISAIHLSI